MTATRCGACAGARTRRQDLGEISSAVLAAMAGVALWPETAAAVPVAPGSGPEVGPGELAYPMPATDGVTIDREQQVIVVRFQGAVYAFNLACPHENTALRWRKRDGRFQCPRHESQYQPDGTFIQGRATRNMDRFAVRRSGDTLIVDVNHLFHSDEQAGEWSTAEVAL
jgi:Rieske Fe-S protein